MKRISGSGTFHTDLGVTQLNFKNPEGVKYVIPSGFCSASAYLFYNHINPSDLIIGSQLRNSYQYRKSYYRIADSFLSQTLNKEQNSD